MSVVVSRPVDVRAHVGLPPDSVLSRIERFMLQGDHWPLSRHPRWLQVLQEGFGHEPVCFEAVEGDTTVGVLCLAKVQSLLFGRFLVALPYLNSGGVSADGETVARKLVDRAAELADREGARYLELRHEEPVEHPCLTARITHKVHMRLGLPSSPTDLWDGFSPKVRNQVRKGQKQGLMVSWGGLDQLPAFYDVFSRNMRDLGTPVYGIKLFRAILRHFPADAELCVLRHEERPVAAALLLHGRGVTEVPSASSLREFRSANANMLMYWHLLERAVQRRQKVFDFGRSSKDSPTFKFKEQWGAQPEPAVWQYYLRTGGETQMRPDNPRYQRVIRIWQRLPVWLTRLVGPSIVRGIP